MNAPKAALLLLLLAVSLTMGVVARSIPFELQSEGLVSNPIRDAWGPDTGPPPERMTDHFGGPRYQQFGLQYRLTAGAARSGPGRAVGATVVLWSARVVTAVLLALVVALLLQGVRTHWDPATATVFLLWVGLAFPVWQFSTNLYWQAWLFYVPFALTLAYYPLTRASPGRFALLCVAVGAAVFVKALTGYEYMSSVLGAVAVPVLLYEARAGLRWKTVIGRTTALAVAGVAGFAGALWLNILDVSTVAGSAGAAADLLSNRVVERSSGDAYGLEVSKLTDAAKYLYMLLDKGQWAFFGLFAVALALHRFVPEETRSPDRWLLVGALAFVVSMTWNSLMIGHMRYHLHVNFITLYLPFNLTVLLCLSDALTRMLGARAGAAARLDRLATIFFRAR